MFPLARRLRSTNSDADPANQGAGFCATMKSDFSNSNIIGFGSSPSRCRRA
jgi:hypothetical protein